jgi:hypothetical protein
VRKPRDDNTPQPLKRLLGIAAAKTTALTIDRGWLQFFAESATKCSARAIDLVQHGTIVDMLNSLHVAWSADAVQEDKRRQTTTGNYQQSLLDC